MSSDKRRKVLAGMASRTQSLEAERDAALSRAAAAEARVAEAEDWLESYHEELRAVPERREEAVALERFLDGLGAAPLAAPPDEHPADELIAALAEARVWSRETFPEQTPASIAAHLSEEARELAERPESMEEMADVAMLFYALADARRVLVGDLAAAVRAKLVLCRERDWSDTSRGYLRAEKAAAEPPPLPAEVRRVVEAAERVADSEPRGEVLARGLITDETAELKLAVAAFRASQEKRGSGG